MSEKIGSLIRERENWLKITNYFPQMNKTIERIIEQFDQKINILMRDHKKKIQKQQSEVSC